MRPEAATLMRQQMRAVGRTYDLLRERTGITVAEVEQLLVTS